VEFGRRLETLRRSRDDLVSAAAAAAADSAKRAAEKRAAEIESQRQWQQQVTTNKGGDVRAQDLGNAGGVGSKTRRSTRQNADSGGGGGGGGVFGGRRAEVGGRDQAADEAEAEQVAQEISSMAGRLKESSMAINQTLRTQTQVRPVGEGADTHRLNNGRKLGLALGFFLSPQSTPMGVYGTIQRKSRAQSGRLQ